MFGWLAGAGNLISKGMGGIGSGLKKFGSELKGAGGDQGDGGDGGDGGDAADPNSMRGRLQSFGAGMGNMQQMGGYGGGSAGANFGAGFLGGFSGARGQRQDLMRRKPKLNPYAAPGTTSDQGEEDLMNQPWQQ